jgi:hypothetical protein
LFHYWNFTLPLWVSAAGGGVQLIENFRLRHLGWEFPEVIRVDGNGG